MSETREQPPTDITTHVLKEVGDSLIILLRNKFLVVSFERTKAYISSMESVITSVQKISPLEKKDVEAFVDALHKLRIASENLLLNATKSNGNSSEASERVSNDHSGTSSVP